RRRHTRCYRDWSSDVCSSDLVAGKAITTIEAIGDAPAGKKVQEAWIALDVPQCGYCQSGQVMSASALLASNAHPTDADIDAAMEIGRASCRERGWTSEHGG